ncbi:MAG: hypothetical protein ACYC1D_02825 [Acidimicrobiales bacterium]
MATTARELVSLVLAYAKQETVDPVKALGRYLLWGVSGAVFVAVGGFLLALGALRAVQSETAPHLSGDWSWVPYIAGVLLAAVGAGLAVSRIARAPR